MSAFGESDTAQLDRYRSYLLLLARMNLNGSPRGKVEPSDVVQQTLLEAHAAGERLPRDEEELCAWLRTALANNIRDQRKHLQRKRREVARERSLEEALAASSEHLAQQCATLHSSPSRRAMRAEELVRLASALWQLPEAQRDAIVWHHLQGCTIGQTAQQIGKTEAAVAGLLHRGLRQLRQILGGDE